MWASRLRTSGLAHAIQDDTINNTVMRNITVLVLFLAHYRLSAQQSIVGTWLSSDGSKAYSVVETRRGVYTGHLVFIAKDSSWPRILQLEHISAKNNQHCYQGVMHSVVSPGLSTAVQLRLSDDGQELTLVLQRMVFFPVRIKWKRITEELWTY